MSPLSVFWYDTNNHKFGVSIVDWQKVSSKEDIEELRIFIISEFNLTDNEKWPIVITGLFRMEE